ncbi:MAG: HD domain-containing protein [Desulfovibrio sp.]|nr:HD domain-containing protein [Desulfovibrio sp.]
MQNAIKQAMGICKTLCRNGVDAYVVNAPLQEHLLEKAETVAVDLACDPDVETLTKLVPNAVASPGSPWMATLSEKDKDGDTQFLFRFYPMETADAAHPELSLLRLTPTMRDMLNPEERLRMRLTSMGHIDDAGPYAGFEEVKSGAIRIAGLPDETLRHNYLLAVRALRFAANFELPIEPNSWLAILRASSRVLDYVAARDIMDEWRKVPAESIHRFVELLSEAHLLQGLIPEVAALSQIRQRRNEEGGEETVFRHTLDCVRLYPEEEFHHDWLGTMATLFHDVGKLYTGEHFDGQWNFYQHHLVGAKVTRKILRRLHFASEDIDLLCHLVSNHMRFHFMLTDRGIRRFMALGEHKRLIAMARADIKARNASNTSFNHNMKYLDRAGTPEQMLEPLLNGNEIMEETNLPQGRLVGLTRAALLEAQKAGVISDREAAKAFVREYARNNME